MLHLYPALELKVVEETSTFPFDMLGGLPQSIAAIENTSMQIRT